MSVRCGARSWLLVMCLVACSAPRQPAAPPPASPPASPPPDAAVVVDAAPRDAEPPNTLLIPDAALTSGNVVIVNTHDSHPCGGYFLDRIYFDEGSAEIPERQRVFADSMTKMIACLLKDAGITKLEIQGHADYKERDPMRLSEERAVVVANMITKHGADARILVPVGYSNAFPIDKAKTKQARAKNRRVEFLILERKSD